MAASSEKSVDRDDLAAWTLQMLRMKRWAQQCFSELYRLSDSMTQKTFTEYTFLNSVRYYLINVVNFPDLSLDLYANLLHQLMEKTKLPATQIKNVIDRINKQVYKAQLQAMPKISDLKIGDSEVVLPVEEFTLQIPRSVYDHLIRINESKEQLISLIIRYELLGRDSSFFWSIDPELIEKINGKLNKNRRMKSLECFGSPWNFTLSNYCSPFEEDGVYGSHGDFFRYLERLSGPVRFFLNPPFTERMIDRSIDAVLDYMAKNPGCDLIALMPSWSNSSGISRLDTLGEEIPQIQLEKGRYVIYDHSSQSYIKPGEVNMIMYFSLADGIAATQKMATMSKEFLKIKARKVLKRKSTKTQTDENSGDDAEGDDEGESSGDSDQDLTKLL